MTDQNGFRLSRRKVLAGLGTIGIASAGAGLGTTAFLSDEEQVSAELEAGRLDLLVDYRSTYSPWDPILDGVYPRSPDVDRVDLDGDETTTDDIVEGPIYVVGQAPDVRDGEGDILSGQRWGELTLNLDACRDIQTQLDNAVEGEPLDNVTIGTAKYENFQESYVDGAAGVLFDLDDVKPKDRGESTISVHLCDNPGYLWLDANVTVNDDNGLVEPEESAGDADDGAGAGELADYLWVSAWYDANCNNVKDTGASGGVPIAVELVIDTSGSMGNDAVGTTNTKLAEAQAAASDLAEAVIDANPGVNQVGLTAFDDTATNVVSLTTDKATILGTSSPPTGIAGLTDGGGTNLGAGVDVGQQDLENNATVGHDRIMVFLSDGSGSGGPNEANDAKTASPPTRIITIAYGAGADTSTLEQMATSDGDAYVAATDNLDAIFTSITEEIIGGEICLYEGSLAGLMDYIGRQNGIPLQGDPAARENCAVVTADQADCFVPGVHCFAFEWYLPCFMEQPDGEGFNQLHSCYGDPTYRADGSDPATTEKTMYDELHERGVLSSPADLDINVVQTDQLEFDVEFAAVQCRHNMTNASPFAETPEVVAPVPEEQTGTN